MYGKLICPECFRIKSPWHWLVQKLLETTHGAHT